MVFGQEDKVLSNCAKFFANEIHWEIKKKMDAETEYPTVGAVAASPVSRASPLIRR
jgi:hypothetical protein